MDVDEIEDLWMSLSNEDTEQLRTFIDWFEGFDEIAFAASQGAENFTPSMLPDLWSHRSPYETPVYRQAYMRGFFSAAAWFLMDRLYLASVCPPGLEAAVHWMNQEHNTNRLRRVPGHQYFD